MSDTHSLTYRMRFKIPDGDIFIHAGDFSQLGKLDEIVEFNNWLGKFLLCKYYEIPFNTGVLNSLQLFRKLTSST